MIGNLLHTWRHHVWRRDCHEVRADAYHDDAAGIQRMIDRAQTDFQPGVYRSGRALSIPDGVKVTGKSSQLGYIANASRLGYIPDATHGLVWGGTGQGQTVWRNNSWTYFNLPARRRVPYWRVALAIGKLALAFYGLCALALLTVYVLSRLGVF